MATYIPRSPYIGLVPYTEQQWNLFVGREAETQVIIDNLRGARLTLLYGPTGVGKTSVLRAGVMHRLRELARENFESTGSPEFVPVYFNAWRDDPLAGLARCVSDSAALVTGEPEPPPEPQQPHSLALTLKSWCDRTQSDLLIILDQFEEYFLYHGREQGPGTFDYEFPRAVNRPDLRVNFLISIREDMLSKLDSFKGRIPNLFGNYLRVEHLSRKDAERAIREPLHKYNALKSPPAEYDIEEKLVEAVCEQVRAGQVVVGQAGLGAVPPLGIRPAGGVERIEATYLQLVMDTLWGAETHDRGSHLLRLKTLEELGGATTIVKSHLNRELELLPSDQQDVAAKIFNHLVTPSGTKIAHSAEDLSGYTGVPGEKIKPVLEFLTRGDVRLLRTVTSELGPRRITRYEIFHDVLGAAVLDWRALYVQAQEEEKSRQEFMAELKAKRQQLRARLLRYLFLFSTLITALTSSLFIYAAWQRNVAQEAIRQLEQERAELAATLALVSELDRLVPYFKAVMRGHGKAVNAVAYSPDGTRIVTGSDDATARVWDATTGRMLYALKHSAPVGHVAFTPDGRLVVTGDDDGKARVWEVANGRLWVVINAHQGRLTDLAISPDSELLATAGADLVGRLWQVNTGVAADVLPGHTGAILKGHTGAINDIRFSDDGTHLVTASDDGTARVWDVYGGLNLRTLAAPRNAVNSAVFSPDGSLVAGAGEDWSVYLWDTSGRPVSVLSGHAGAVKSVAFSPDGTLMASAGNDKTVKIWDVRTGRSLRELSGHANSVTEAGFDKSGLRIISASADSTARVWGVNDGHLLFELRGHTGGVNSAAFSPDGNSAVTASEDATARIWNVPGAIVSRVSEVTLQVEPDRYEGPCPAAVRLVGRISVADVGGDVRYRFVRYDTGSAGIERALTFDAPGMKEVSAVYRFGGRAGLHISGAFYLETLSPGQVRSESVNFDVRCSVPPEAGNVEADPTPTPGPPAHRAP